MRVTSATSSPLKAVPLQHPNVRVEVFADHEVMHPPHRLKKAMALAGPAGAFDMEAVERAERALAGLAPAFADFMQADVAALDRALVAVRDAGVSDATAAALFRAAHDIKGGGTTFGFPAASRVAAGLCRLLESRDRVSVPLHLVETHAEAIRAIVRQGARDEDAIAMALAAHLCDMVDAVIGREE